MSSTRHTILQALRDIRLVDPHSHINPYSPASKTLADILGYHYYTELAHSAGMPKSQIEEPGIAPRELVRRLVGGLEHLTNTAQHAWLIDICQRFFGFQGDVIDSSNWEAIYDAAETKMQLADWSDAVLEQSNVEAVFLTNDFDDTLEGFDTNVYVPCLRTDDLVFHLSKNEVRARLEACTKMELRDLASLRDSLEQRFQHFVSHGARACAISLPPDFSPTPVTDGRASTALNAVLRLGLSADASHRAALGKRVFWTIVELCEQYGLPMDLMIGVNRGVYADGVYQGRDLYDSRVSLTQYRELFNAFPKVMFPISVLASVTNQELVSHAWIFPNVLTNGHWWYSNTPSFIHRDAAARLEAVPRNKQIGYYSDAYKLEFIAPKFDMYRQILAGILADDFVIQRGWSEEKAIQLGWQVLRGNVDTIFPRRTPSNTEQPASPGRQDAAILGTVAPLAMAPLALEEDPVAVMSQLDSDPEPDTLGLALEEPALQPTAAEQAPDSADSLLSDQPTRDEGTNETLDHSTIVEWAPSEDIPSETGLLSFEQIDEPELAELADFDELELVEGGVHETLPLETPFDLLPETDQTAASDPHATIEMTPSYLDEAKPELADHDEEIHYFRADDMGMSAEELIHLESTDPSPHSGLVADPVTGEPTWPIDADPASEPALEETYLLPEDPDPEDDETASLEITNLDDLELLPLDDPSDLFADDSSLEGDAASAGPLDQDTESLLDFDEDQEK